MRGATDATQLVGLALEFQFTHPVRGATALLDLGDVDGLVSIHAPRAGCDHREGDCERGEEAFQFTHPVRGATGGLRKVYTEIEFQFTHPVRGATLLGTSLTRYIPVSIHAPRAGCDDGEEVKMTDEQSFNSRTPCGVRR